LASPTPACVVVVTELQDFSIRSSAVSHTGAWRVEEVRGLGLGTVGWRLGGGHGRSVGVRPLGSTLGRWPVIAGEAQTGIDTAIAAAQGQASRRQRLDGKPRRAPFSAPAADTHERSELDYLRSTVANEPTSGE
jgi:hypothetical protein